MISINEIITLPCSSQVVQSDQIEEFFIFCEIHTQGLTVLMSEVVNEENARMTLHSPGYSRGNETQSPLHFLAFFNSLVSKKNLQKVLVLKSDNPLLNSKIYSYLAQEAERFVSPGNQ